MGDKEKIENLNQVVQRLIDENSQLRRKVDEVEVLLRHRAPNASGLKLVASVATLLNDRDRAQDRIGFFRDELKKVQSMLSAKQFKEAIQEISHFLFNNPR